MSFKKTIREKDKRRKIVDFSRGCFGVTDEKERKDRGLIECFGIKLALLVLLLLTITPPYTYAGDLSFVGQLRERFEILDGMNKKTYGDSSIDSKGNEKGDSNDNLLVHRLMAGFVYKQSPKITWRLIGYDARVWGWSLEAVPQTFRLFMIRQKVEIRRYHELLIICGAFVT